MKCLVCTWSDQVLTCGLYDPAQGRWLPTPRERAESERERAESERERAEHERNERIRIEAEAQRLRQEIAGSSTGSKPVSDRIHRCSVEVSIRACIRGVAPSLRGTPML